MASKADTCQLSVSFTCHSSGPIYVTLVESTLFYGTENIPSFVMFRDTSVSLFLMSSGSDGIGHVEVHSKMKPLFTAIVVCKINCVRDHA